MVGTSPAAGELYASIGTNKTAVNTGLSKAGGTAIVESGYCSSSEYDGNYAWTMDARGDDVFYDGKDNLFYVRCVLEFENSGNGTAKVCGADYIYTCTGTGESPIGESCGGKYIGCTTNCAVGDILNSDKTCTSGKVSGKTPIGVISYINGSTRIAIQLTNPGRMTWSSSYVDISGITNYSSSPHTTDFRGKRNTQAWVNYYGASATSYAPGYCDAYSTAGTSAGDWYLPAQGELYASIWTNKSAVNTGLSNAGGTAIVGYWHWSSSEYGGDDAWIVFADGDGVTDYPKLGVGTYVRYVLAF